MKIDISQEQKIEFLIEVDGTSLEEVDSRLVLEENGFSIGINGSTDSKDGKSRLIFKIPELKGVIKAESVNARIEMFVEDRFYIPYETNIEIERPVTFMVNEGMVEEGKKSPFSVSDAKVISEKKVRKPKPTPKQEAPKPKPEPEILDEEIEVEVESDNTFNFDHLLSEFESHRDFSKLKLDTIEAIRNHPLYEELSEDSKEKTSILKSKRIKTEDLYFKVMKGILNEMMKKGANVILE